MLCKKPFTKGATSHGCGQCMPCRIKRRRIWTHRMMLEAAVHPASSFITLTYNDQNNPGTLVPSHLQLWLKRIRKGYGAPLRFYGVGEYGDITERPHYHVALFGHDPKHHYAVERTWDYGYSYTGELTLHSAQYIAGYVTKKLTATNDPRLNGRYPEFARMSLRPGIGAPGLSQVAAALQNKHGWDEITRTADVPGMLRHGGRTMPLGRYMRLRLRQEMNFTELTQSEEAAFKAQQKMLDVYRDYLTAEELQNPFKLHLGKERHEAKEKVKLEKLDARMRATKRNKRL